MLDKEKLNWLVYAAAICLGAFLMFLIQPVVGKIITPQFGGVSQVWSACLMFFQLALLIGYGFTWATSRFPVRTQAIVYLLVFGLSSFLIHIPTGSGWSPLPDTDPMLSLLKNLFLYVALPATLLSTVSTMLQNWYGLGRQGNPYHLYSISNIGSMAGLLAYPVLIEPYFTVGQTLTYWTNAYWVLVVLIAVCCVKMLRNGSGSLDETVAQETDGETAPARQDYGWWLGLSACGTILLISMTHQLSASIAPVPMLWILPLSVYLLTFILCFSHDKVYSSRFFIFGSQVSFLLLALFVFSKLSVIGSFNVTIGFSILMHLTVLFFLCMMCHGEIYQRRPSASYLPVFYFFVALGGALGGVFVNLIAPVIFDSYLEFPLIIMLLGILTFYLVNQYKLSLFKSEGLNKIYLALAGLLMAYCYVTTFLKPNDAQVLAKRNFYGSARIMLERQLSSLTLTNGTTMHGSMILDLKSHQFEYTPTTYYVESSAAGIAEKLLRKHRPDQGLKIGVVGLGVGTLAAYGQKGDEITFFEIDPKIREMAENNFRFLGDSKAKIQMVMGDGRLSLAKLPPQQYDMLIIDAFSNDAIPVHLLTKEAMQIYLSHLKPDGLLLFHISNSYLKLHTVTGNLAHDFHLNGISILSNRAEAKATTSLYSVMSRDNWFIGEVRKPEIRQQYPNIQTATLKWTPKIGLWTDDYSNLFSILI